MIESQPLIGESVKAVKNDKSQPSIVKKLKYSNWASIVFYAAILGTIIYFGYPYLLTSNNGRLDPSRIATISSGKGYSTEALSDLINGLPNLNEEMTFNMFSGYLTANDNREIFYWFVESQSDTADTDPLVLWTNGGPGCSGLVGFLTEHGPYWVYDDLSLRSNPYSWNKMANVLYIEQPYGVGFSVPSVGKDWVSGDDNAVSDIDALVRDFLLKYPKYQNNEFYLASESYGGHYMPLSAKKILENNAAATKTPQTINLKGYLVGNPLMSYYQNEEGFLTALYGHGLIKSTIYNEWVESCQDNEHAILYSDTCEVLYVKAYIESYDIDVYAMDYPNCVMDTSDLVSKSEEHSLNIDDHFYTERQTFHERARERASNLVANDAVLMKHFDNDEESIELFKSQVDNAITSTDVPYISCNTYYLERYLNLDSVQTALHTKENSGWSYCSTKVFNSWPESDWLTSMTDTYNTLINDYDIKILVYSGDDDSVCAIQGTMKFIDQLGYSIDSSADWTEWTFEDQVAGFHTKYVKSDGSRAFHFQTVRSAGHMVPTTQPERGLELFNRFFNYYD